MIKIKLLKEDAKPEAVDGRLFPIKLSIAKKQSGISVAASTTGQGDQQQQDDVVKSQQADSIPANQLLPGQSSMDLDKFVGMAIQMFLRIPSPPGGFPKGPGGDLGAIISSDNHIMDGHHRWAATICVNPQAPVGGLKVGMPAAKLIGVLNAWTVAHGGNGKQSTHMLKDLTGDVVAKRVMEIVTRPEGLTGGKTPIPKEQLDKYMKIARTNAQQMSEKMKQNWDSFGAYKKIQDWMPTKIDMPAIEPDQLQKVASDLMSGKMDVNPPYSKATQNQSGALAQKGVATNPQQMKANKTIKETLGRWRELAGIVKG